jgi:NitT/TauT family transport system ATP-binding protein
MNSKNNDAIIIKSVSHSYQTDTGKLPVLNNLNIRVPYHGFTAVVGPSGCGKSTLTKLISGLLKPDNGEVWLNNEKVIEPKPIVGMAFQNPVLLEWRTVLQNVILPLEIVPNNFSQLEKEKRARNLLSLVGLEGFEEKKPSELSGGMKTKSFIM